MNRRRALALGLALLAAAAAAPAASPVDRVVVRKAERTLTLMSGRSAVRRFPVHLGRAPVGHKQRQGDFRTPEGVYRVDARNPASRYYRALRLSYPSAADRAAAAARGQPPGGDIMIHGMPPSPARRGLLLYDGRDWTDGCIAVSNAHMQEVWELVETGTPVEILP